VPLLVSLFTDSTSESSAEMIRILQENGETVLCLGSDQKPENIMVFLQSDISVSAHPAPEFEGCLLQKHQNSGMSNTKMQSLSNLEFKSEYILEDLCSQLTALPCAFTHLANFNLHEFVNELVYHGRKLLNNYSQVSFIH
jgi:hypothetical protein